jgi:hypothetical protein
MLSAVEVWKESVEMLFANFASRDYGSIRIQSPPKPFVKCQNSLPIKKQSMKHKVDRFHHVAMLDISTMESREGKSKSTAFLHVTRLRSILMLLLSSESADIGVFAQICNASAIECHPCKNAIKVLESMIRILIRSMQI